MAAIREVSWVDLNNLVGEDDRIVRLDNVASETHNAAALGGAMAHWYNVTFKHE